MSVPTMNDQLREFACDVVVGLRSRPKSLPSRWFYDERGSGLFSKIMDTDAYYPARTEWEILRQHGSDLLATSERELDVLDLGAGDGRKTETIIATLESFGVSVRYVPIDISIDALNGTVTRIAQTMPNVVVQPIEGSFNDGLRATRKRGRPRLVLFLGSNIGNFDMAQARRFLFRIWAELQEGDRLLIGFDLKKDIAVLLRAYNDPEGYTREFNLNLLDRMNRQLGADFNREAFEHFGTYNAITGAMESYLVSRVAQRVGISALSLHVDFEPWEAIRTEYSYKYLPKDVLQLATDTGFTVEKSQTDARGWFMSCVWRVAKLPT